MFCEFFKNCYIQHLFVFLNNGCESECSRVRVEVIFFLEFGRNVMKSNIQCTKEKMRKIRTKSRMTGTPKFTGLGKLEDYQTSLRKTLNKCAKYKYITIHIQMISSAVNLRDFSKPTYKLNIFPEITTKLQFDSTFSPHPPPKPSLVGGGLGLRNRKRRPNVGDNLRLNLSYMVFPSPPSLYLVHLLFQTLVERK